MGAKFFPLGRVHKFQMAKDLGLLDGFEIPSDGFSWYAPRGHEGGIEGSRHKRRYIAERPLARPTLHPDRSTIECRTPTDYGVFERQFSSKDGLTPFLITPRRIPSLFLS